MKRYDANWAERAMERCSDGLWAPYEDVAAVEAERYALRTALRDVLLTVNRNDRAIKHEAGSMVWIVKEELDRWAKALGEGR